MSVISNTCSGKGAFTEARRRGDRTCVRAEERGNGRPVYEDVQAHVLSLEERNGIEPMRRWRIAMNGARFNDIHRERTKIADEWTVERPFANASTLARSVVRSP